MPIDETLRALDDLIRAGKVRYIGTSTYAAWQVVEVAVGRQGARAQPLRHASSRPTTCSTGASSASWCRWRRPTAWRLIPWSPLAGGLLTGKYRRGETRRPRAALTAIETAGDGRKHFTDAAFDVLDVVEPIAQEKDCTPSQLALAWCAHQPGITSPIIGPRTMEQLEDNLRAARDHGHESGPRAVRRGGGSGAGDRPVLRGGLWPASVQLVIRG